MALSEEQIQRYSRQILLRDLGGGGQERLLRAGVRLASAGPAALTAAAYLAAGGTRVAAADVPLGPGVEGFLFPAGREGAGAAHALAEVLPAFNADAAVAPEPAGSLAEAPHRCEGAGPWVVLGSGAAGAAVVFRTAAGCSGCFEATAATLGPPDPGPGTVSLGALGALAFQRAALGRGEALGARRLSSEGTWSSMEIVKCPGCR